jgi:gliding-associated putative ABC transporter substrate-binding component GldG
MFKRKGLFNGGYFAGIITVLILLNVIFSLLHFKLDLTADQRFSLARGTQAFLKKTKNQESRISLKIYLEGDLPAEIQGFRNAIEDKLKDFKSLAGNRIEYEFVNPNEGHASKKEEYFFLKGLFNKGILPTKVVYVKNGIQSQLVLWAGAEISCSANGVIKESYLQFLPGTPNGDPLELNRINPIIENALNNLEYNLLSAMRKISQSEKKRIAFLQGHGELKEQETINARAVLSPYFYLTTLTLGSEASYQELNDLDGIIVANPTQPFSDLDLYFLDQFVMNGGRLMVFMNTLHHQEDSLGKNYFDHTLRKNIKLDRMMFDYGIRMHENYVFDRVCGYRKVQLKNTSSLSWPYYVLSSPSLHPITRNIDPVYLPYPNELQLIERPGVRLSKILTTSSNANRSGIAPQISLMDFQVFGENPLFIENPDDPINKITLAAMAEGEIPSYFSNRELADENSRSIESVAEMRKVPKKFRIKKVKSSNDAKVFVVGNGTFLANEYDSVFQGGSYQYRPYPAFPFNALKYSKIPDINGRPLIYGNQEFIQNLVDYMLGDNSVLDIRSRQIELRQLDQRKMMDEGNFIRYINLLIPFLLIALLGGVIFFLRKKKYQ